MATISIVAAGCVSFALSAWYPWYWTQRWGENGWTCCQSTGATGAPHPQAGFFSCRWDCGWHQSTFHEVNAISLERYSGPDREVATQRDPHLEHWRECTGLPLDMGVRGHDIVTEQYASTMKMKINRDGTIVYPLSSLPGGATQPTTHLTEAVDRLRDGPSNKPDGYRSRLNKLSEAVHFDLLRASSLKDRFRSGSQLRPSTDTDASAPSRGGAPKTHD